MNRLRFRNYKDAYTGIDYSNVLNIYLNGDALPYGYNKLIHIGKCEEHKLLNTVAIRCVCYE